MNTEISIIGIIVKNIENVDELNKILSEYGKKYIIGRMGIPHIKKKINIITIVMDAPHNIIDELKNIISNLDGINII